MTARRFPPPWSAEVTPNCFIVRDANGQALSYVYYESAPGRRQAAKLLSKDEERRIAANVAKLPELLFMPRSKLALNSLVKAEHVLDGIHDSRFAVLEAICVNLRLILFDCRGR